MRAHCISHTHTHTHTHRHTCVFVFRARWLNSRGDIQAQHHPIRALEGYAFSQDVDDGGDLCECVSECDYCDCNIIVDDGGGAVCVCTQV